MKLEWEKSEKPKEVLNEAIKWLNHVVEQLSKPGPRVFLKEVADAGLPEKVEQIIGSEVRRRLNAEFARRVEEESNRKALTKRALKAKDYSKAASLVKKVLEDDHLRKTLSKEALRFSKKRIQQQM
ncbi:MAG: hypothetical protein QXM60_06320 [Thermoplasmatales archaeon]